jgi:sulfur relay (sulfurtransferase) complex TusBCD TusD component (DsrE family)
VQVESGAYLDPITCGEAPVEEATAQTVLVLNDAPYGSERSYNALRLALAMAKQADAGPIAIYLLGDAVGAAVAGQRTPDGYYNLERMLRGVLRAGSVFA